jgi:hypothetical protein
MAKLRLGGIKLSPLLGDAFLESLGARLEFISFRGECREALIWMGMEAMPGRVAIRVEDGSVLPAAGRPPSVDAPGALLYEADPAAIRAHCLGTLCDDLELRALGDSNGYLTSDVAASSPWLTQYRVLYSGKGDLKSTIKALRDLDGTIEAVKTRVRGIDMVALGKKIAFRGARRCCLLVYSVGASVRHVLAQRDGSVTSKLA